MHGLKTRATNSGPHAGELLLRAADPPAANCSPQKMQYWSTMSGYAPHL
jgi:hypothetical protein